MADNDFPIDINYAKIADWLVRLDFWVLGKRKQLTKKKFFFTATTTITTTTTTIIFEKKNQ